MRVAGEKKLVDLVPQLILYLDYPADYFLAVAYDVPLREGPDAEANARKEWPAFDAILKIGAPATPHLEKFIDDPGEEARFRLAALETLEVIAPDKAEIAGKRLELSLREKGATNTLNKVEAVLQGKRHFWGVERRSD
jgi:hypothetical protein